MSHFKLHAKTNFLARKFKHTLNRVLSNNIDIWDFFDLFSATVKVFKQLDSYAQKEWFLRRIGNWPCCENKESRAIFSAGGLNNLDFTIILLIKSFWVWFCEIIYIINPGLSLCVRTSTAETPWHMIMKLCMRFTHHMEEDFYGKKNLKIEKKIIICLESWICPGCRCCTWKFIGCRVWQYIDCPEAWNWPGCRCAWKFIDGPEAWNCPGCRCIHCWSRSLVS